MQKDAFVVAAGKRAYLLFPAAQLLIVMIEADNTAQNIAKASSITNTWRRGLMLNLAKPEVSPYPPGSVKIAANETVAMRESTRRRVLVVLFHNVSGFSLALGLRRSVFTRN